MWSWLRTGEEEGVKRYHDWKGLGRDWRKRRLSVEKTYEKPYGNLLLF